MLIGNTNLYRYVCHAVSCLSCATVSKPRNSGYASTEYYTTIESDSVLFFEEPFIACLLNQMRVLIIWHANIHIIIIIFINNNS